MRGGQGSNDWGGVHPSTVGKVLTQVRGWVCTEGGGGGGCKKIIEGWSGQR